MAPKPKPPSAAELRANKDFFSKMGFTPAKKVPEDAATAQAARVAADAAKEQAARVAVAGQKLREAAARSFEVRASVVRRGATSAPSAPSGDGVRRMDVDAQRADSSAAAAGAAAAAGGGGADTTTNDLVNAQLLPEKPGGDKSPEEELDWGAWDDLDSGEQQPGAVGGADALRVVGY